MTYELSIGIQKSKDFDGFLDEVDFMRLFSEKYKYYSHPTISHKPLDFIILSQICVYHHLFMSCFLLLLFLCQMLQKSIITYDFLFFFLWA